MTVLDTRKTDADIQADVLAELGEDGRFNAAEIGVEVDSAVVTLSGIVTTYAKLIAAAEVAGRVAGVKDVANELEVHLPGVSIRDDTDIAKAVRHALKWEPDVPEERIDTVVRQGVVTLKGSVEHWYQRKAALDAIRDLIGVVSVKNDIEVLPPKLSDLEIREDIERAIARRMPRMAPRIKVSVRRGLVTLSGTVPMFADRVEAEDASLRVRGVYRVLNELAVTGASE